MTTNTALSLTLLAHGTEPELAEFAASRTADTVDQPTFRILTETYALEPAAGGTGALPGQYGSWLQYNAGVPFERMNDGRWIEIFDIAGYAAEALAEQWPTMEFIVVAGTGGLGSFATAALASNGRHQGWTTVDAVAAWPTIVLADTARATPSVAADGRWTDLSSGADVAAAVRTLLDATAAPEVCVRIVNGASQDTFIDIAVDGWELLTMAEPRTQRGEWALTSIRDASTDTDSDHE